MAFELTGNPLNDISAPIEELSESFNSTLVFDFGNGVGITQYTFWMIIICAIVLVGVLVGVRKIKVVPEASSRALWSGVTTQFAATWVRALSAMAIRSTSRSSRPCFSSSSSPT